MSSQILTSGISADELLESIRLIVRNEVQAIPQPEKLKPFLTIREAAEFSGLSKQTLYRLTSERKIPHIKRGRLLFNREELSAWLQAAKVK